MYYTWKSLVTRLFVLFQIKLDYNNEAILEFRMDAIERMILAVDGHDSKGYNSEGEEEDESESEENAEPIQEGEEPMQEAAEPMQEAEEPMQEEEENPEDYTDTESQDEAQEPQEEPEDNLEYLQEAELQEEPENNSDNAPEVEPQQDEPYAQEESNFESEEDVQQEEEGNSKVIDDISGDFPPIVPNLANLASSQLFGFSELLNCMHSFPQKVQQGDQQHVQVGTNDPVQHLDLLNSINNETKEVDETKRNGEPQKMDSTTTEKLDKIDDLDLSLGL